MRPWRPQPPAHSLISPQNSRQNSCRRKAKHYSYLVVFGILVYLEILFLSQWSLESLLNSREHDIEQFSIQKLSNIPTTDKLSSQTSTADGTFNGLPVRLQVISNTSHTKPKSNIHCIGQNYQEDHWMVRSCNIRFMCFNLKEQEYEIYSRPEDISLKEWTDQIRTMDTSQTLMQSATGAVSDTDSMAASVALGGISLGLEKSAPMDNAQSNQLKYFPKVRSIPPTTFYALPQDVVMIPYHQTLSISNPMMSVLWDDFLSIFNLLQMFQFDQSYRPLLLRQNDVGNDGDLIQATSSLMMRLPSILTSQGKAKLKLSNSFQLLRRAQEPKSDLVCAKQGLMGTAALTSRGTHRTRGITNTDSGGNLKPARQRRRSVILKEGMTQNRGRGGMFWEFRLWALQNLALDEMDSTKAPHKIVLSKSSIPSIQPLFEAIKTTFASDTRVSKVEEYDSKFVALVEQIKLLSQTSVLVTSIPEDLATAPFLPNGASLILLYAPKQGTLSEEYWDLINNLSHIRVHWLPLVEANDGHDDIKNAKTVILLVNRAISFDDSDGLD